MEFNWLGVAFVSEDLPIEIEEMVNEKMEELREKAMEDFDMFLDRNNLEQEQLKIAPDYGCYR